MTSKRIKAPGAKHQKKVRGRKQNKNLRAAEAQRTQRILREQARRRRAVLADASRQHA